MVNTLETYLFKRVLILGTGIIILEHRSLAGDPYLNGSSREHWMPLGFPVLSDRIREESCGGAKRRQGKED